MNPRIRTWALLSLLGLLGAWIVWRAGGPSSYPASEETIAVKNPQTSTLNSAAPRPGKADFQTQKASSLAAKTALLRSNTFALHYSDAPLNPASTNVFLKYRLRNTTNGMDYLTRNEQAILLRNAVIDTGLRAELPIPASLRAQGDPGAYIVQSRGLLTDAFRTQLAEAGAKIVSYVPNNGYLVQASAKSAQALAASPDTQAVLPWEPYYKLHPLLLAKAVEQEALPSGTYLNVLLFPGEDEQAEQDCRAMGLEIYGTDRSPFGKQLIVRMESDELVWLAQMPSVQNIEPYVRRQPANDLSRTRVRVSTNTITPTQHLDLDGTGVIVNVNDTGVYENHSALTPRVWGDPNYPNSRVDTNGHGTHVAGTIGGDGANAPTDASGSEPGASFRGMASAAKIYASLIDLLTGPYISDAYLQENAARTNAFISNNSWFLPGIYDYNISAASWDMAVRDAIPTRTNAQPILPVFAAGNSGNGNDDGQDGAAESINAPGTAKNVITVGAIENLRRMKVQFTGTNGTTSNSFFYVSTDSSNQVASFSGRGNVGVGTEGRYGRFKPDLVAPGTFVVSTRPQGWRNNQTNYPAGTNGLSLREADLTLSSDEYGYEYGTSMSAAVVSGILALMQHGFISAGFTNPSPALMKALLINGARSLSRDYHLQARTLLNLQGWGLANIANSFFGFMKNTGGPPTSGVPLLYFDQDLQTNVLATGDSFTRIINVSRNATNYPLRVTLVWTDPPGNPAVGVKLVNDLDLIVTNLTTGEVFVGNNISGGTDTSDPSPTNEVLVTDNINNVENVILNTPMRGYDYSITVLAKRVNVNAVTAYTNGISASNELPRAIVQDFALVVSTGNSRFGTLSLTSTNGSANPAPFVTYVTNGIPLLGQRVGANSPLISNTNGNTNQWNFYVFQNTNTYYMTNTGGGRYAAFITFWPPNLARPRVSGADIDMYVSTDYNLTNLDVAAVSNSLKSVNRGGTEFIYLTNATTTDYYIGIKSEDQQSAEYSFIAFSSNVPFSDTDTNGNQIIRFFPAPADIPDGVPEEPKGVTLFGIAMKPMIIQKIIVTNTLWHQLGGDLFGELIHATNSVVLNSFRPFQGATNWIYDDLPTGLDPDVIPTDGPGSLRDFVGTEASGQAWQFTMVDSALIHTGRIDQLVALIEPRDDTNLFGPGIVVTIQPQHWFYTAVDVPSDATNLTVCLALTNGLAELYLRRGNFPDQTNYDAFAIYGPPGGCLSITPLDSPPLSAGRYYIGVYNPTAVPITVRLWVSIERDLRGDTYVRYRSRSSTPILDDAETNSIIFVRDAREIVSLNVGIRVNHPRISDLVFHLVSPQGTRIMLMEARGGPYGTNAGSGFLVTNSFTITPSGNATPQTNIIDSPSYFGTVHIDYEFYPIPDQMVIYYDGQMIFDSGMVSGPGSFNVDYGPGLSTNVVIVMNPVGGNAGTAWDYTGYLMAGRYFYLTFTENTNLTTLPIKFGTPPFVTNAPASAIGPFMISDFEVAATNYVATNTVDGWLVLTNQVSVMSDTNIARTGSNFLTLADAQIFRYLPTQPGLQYTLRYAYRGPGLVGWWPGLVKYYQTNNAVEIVSGLNGMLYGNASAVPGYVAQAFNYPNAGVSKVLAPDSPSYALTNSLSIEGWVNIAQSSLPPPIGVMDIATNPANGHIYYLLSNDYWTNSEARAIALGGNLVTINDQAENDWLYSLWGTTRSLWTGFTDRAVEGTFVWTSGEPITYTNWRPGEPNDGPGIPGGEDYAYIYADIGGQGGLWNDGGDVVINVGEPPLQGVVEVNPPAEGYIFFRGDNQSNCYALQVTNGEVMFWIQDASLQRASIHVPCPASAWLHIAATLDNSSQEMRLYTNGVLATNLVTTIHPWGLLGTNDEPGIGIGQHSGTVNNQFQFHGLIDEASLYNRALSLAEIQAISRATNLGKYNYLFGPSNIPNAQVILDGLTNIVTGTTTWIDDYISFKGGQDARGTPLQITGQTLGMLFDSFILIAPDPAVYYMPEESFAPLRGQLAYGNWRLEIWDARIGAFLTNNDLASWQLEFTFANTNPPAITLTNGQCWTGTLETSNTVYFKVLVPYGAVIATNSLVSISNDVVLMMDQDNIPTGLAPPDDYQSAPGTNIVQVMSPITVPPLLQGRSYYYLAVRNDNPTNNNDITLCVNFYIDFDYYLNIYDLTPPPHYLCTNIPANNLIAYYRFDAATNACVITFSVTNIQNGDVDLVVNHGLPLPTPATNYAMSANFWTNDERITIIDFSLTVVPGTWYIGVYTPGTNAVTNYCISVTEILLNIFELTRDVPYSNMVDAITNFQVYHLAVPTNAFETDVDILEFPSGNVDLYINYSWPPPTPTNYIWASANPGNNAERLQIHTNGVPPLIPGDWYISVVNVANMNVSYELLATIFDTNVIDVCDGCPIIVNNNAVIPIRPAAIPSAGQSAGGDDTRYFSFAMPINTFQVNVEIFGMDGNVDLFVRTNLPMPRPDFYSYASTNMGATNEIIIVNTNLVGPTWYAAIVNRETNPVTSIFRATKVYDTNIILLTNQMVKTNTVLAYFPTNFPPSLKNYDYYTFDIAPNALQAYVRLYYLGGDVDLYLRKGLPLPAQDLYYYSSTNTGTNDEAITLTYVSRPVPLSAGTWYAAVLNRETNPTTYTIEFVQDPNTNLVQLTNCTAYGTTIAANSSNYFYFTVSTNAIEARFDFSVLTNLGLDLFIKLDPPLPMATNSPYAATNVVNTTTNLAIIYNSLTDPLMPGVWYATVINSNDVAVNYTFQAEEFLREINPIVLTNGLAFSNNIPVRYGACADQFYVFTVPTNSSWSLFEIRHPSDTNLRFFLQRELPLPWRPTGSNYATNNFGANGAFFVVTTNTMPVPLAPGDWYMGVLNYGSTNVNYVVRATAFADDQPLIDLTNGIPYASYVSYGTIYDWDYYRFQVSTNALQVSYEILPYPVGNVELYAGRDLVVADPSRRWSYQSTNLGASAEIIPVLTNSTPEPLVDGYWYLGVQAGFNAGTNINYEIRATEYVFGSNIIVLSNATPVTATNPVSPYTIDYYAFAVSTNAVQANFEILNANGNVDLFVRRDLPLPTPANAYYASTNAGMANEWIAVATNSLPVPLTNGFWFAGVVNRDTNAVVYTIRITEIYDTNILILTNCLVYSNTIAAQSNIYFMLPLTNQGYEALFELSMLTNLPLSLYVRRELVLPMTNYYSYALTNTNTFSMVALPVVYNASTNPLLPGYWFVTLVNTNEQPVGFALQASFFDSADVIGLVSGAPTTNTIAPRQSSCDDQFYGLQIGAFTTWALFQLELLTNSGLALFVNHDVPLPHGTNFDYGIAPLTNRYNMILVTTNSQPPLTNSVWYMGVTNGSDTNVTYLVRVVEMTNPPPPLLTNGTPVTNTVAGDGTDYYLYHISSNAIQSNFEILPYPSGNVDLFIAPATAFLPGTNQFYHASTNFGTNAEFIAVLANASTNPLTPGDWLMAVVNRTTVPVTYALRVTEFIPGTDNLIRLTNSVPFTNTPAISNRVTGDIDYYVFEVPTNATYATFDIRRPNTNVDLIVRHTLPLPTLSDYDYLSAQPGVREEQILVRTNELPIPLTPGDWYIGVTHSNIPSSNVIYTIVANSYTNPPPSLLVLSNAVPVTNSVSLTNLANYYKFTVSSNALEAHFEILQPSGNVDLFVNYGLPWASDTNFAWASTNLGASNEFIRVRADSNAPIAGDWYLFVLNRETNNLQYIIRATEFVPGTPQLVWLTNAISYITNINSSSNVFDPGVQYYYFDVPGAVQVNLEIFAANGNVDLYAERGILPLLEPFYLPNTNVFPYASTNGGTSYELIALQYTGSLANPVPMPQILAVVNCDASNVTYTVRATAFVPGTDTLGALSNAAPVTNTTTGTLIDYYMFAISTNAVRAQFEILEPSDDVDLLVHKGTPLPTLEHFDYQSTNSWTNAELVVVFNNETNVLAGDWFLGVVHRTTNPVTYTVVATEYDQYGTNLLITGLTTSDLAVCVSWTNMLLGVNYHLEGCTNLNSTNWLALSPAIRASSTATNYCLDWPSPWHFFRVAEGLALTLPTNNIPLLGNGEIRDNTVGPGLVDYYRFQVSPHAVQANFEILPYPSGNVDLFISHNTVEPSPTYCFYASTNSSTNIESIIVLTNSTPYPLVQGFWYIAVLNRETNDVRYLLRATQFVPEDNIIRLTNAIAHVTTRDAPYPAIDYYVFSVSSNSVRAQFEVINPGGNVDLLARKGLPLPDPARFDYQSANPGRSDELIMLFTNSAPVPLSVGDWYLGVVHRITNLISYSVLAREYSDAGANLRITRLDANSNSMVLTWTNMLVGVNYHVQGVTNLISTNWTAMSATIRAATTGTNYSLPWPAEEFWFFRISEGLAPVSGAQVSQFTCGVSGSNQFALRWQAPANLTYQVQWSPGLAPAAWRTFTNIVASTNGIYNFTDDNSQTGGAAPKRFYRVMLRP